MVQQSVSDDDIAALIRRIDEAAAAFMRGDVDRYLALIKHAEDYTLLMPLGGPPIHGFDPSPERLEEIARFFRSGEATVEVAQTYASGDLVVLVVIERQHGEVGGLPDQDWSLRVTLVFRRVGEDWHLVHRHADPLLRGISLEQASAMVRGVPIPG